MYRRPKFLEVLLEIREQMAREADYDVDRFAEMIRSGHIAAGSYTLSTEAREEKREPLTAIRVRRGKTAA